MITSEASIRLAQARARIKTRHPSASRDGELATSLLTLADDFGTIERAFDLLNAYGQAKFGDEWWPGNAQPWLGGEEGAELELLLGA